jgi:hypothetical protein
MPSWSIDFSNDGASRLKKGRLQIARAFRQPFANHSTGRADAGNESKIVHAHIPVSQLGRRGAHIMSREAVLENVRRFRAIASLYRQTAAFRPGQSWSLLGQAKEWEHRALTELETYFKGSGFPTSAQSGTAVAA